MATRLGNDLLALRAKAGPTDAGRIEAVVCNLDRTAAVLDIKGKRLQMSAAWRNCLQLYHTLTGRAWTPPAKGAGK